MPDLKRVPVLLDKKLYERAVAHGKSRGCTSFGETVRDMIRQSLDGAAAKQKAIQSDNTPEKDRDL